MSALIKNYVQKICCAFSFTILLSSTSHGELVINDVNPDTWVQECATVYQDTCCRSLGGSYYVNYSSYDILKSPSGLCMPEFSCAWEKCIPEKYGSTQVDTFVNDFLTGIDITPTTTYSEVESVLGSRLNLPAKIAFPTQASDIVEAIQLAKNEGLSVSIISTGHSYTGANTKAGSVQLNLRNYPKYSKLSGVVECSDSIVNDQTNLDSAACKLALARDKKALLRVGGGEIFNDTASSLFSLKDPSTGYSKYLMLHGVGTVGAAGGWLQGGGLGWGQERVWGLGVDQVLEIELILADGRYVKFYPTEWEYVDGFIYPKTKKVEGLCNRNVFADESMWVWESCDDPVPPFDDLWFAVRGGGGGTFGVVTSVKLQLHENIPFYQFSFNETVAAEYEVAIANLQADEQAIVQYNAALCIVDFSISFLFHPENIGVTRDQSNHCGSPSLMPTIPVMVCLGEDAGTAVENAYKTSMDQCGSALLADYPDIVDIIVDLYFTSGPFDSLIGFQNFDSGAQQNVPGQLLDDGPSILPQHRPYLGDMGSLQVPETWLAEKSDEVFEVFVNYGASGQHVTGGNVGIAHDQMNAVPIPQRQSGFSSATFEGLPTELQNRLLSLFLQDTVAAGDPFPGITEVNHIASFTYGPLKIDMTKVCPTSYSEEQKDKECYSFQESIWGVEITARLEHIKYAVDPFHLFKCYGCIEPRSDAPISNPTINPVPLPTLKPTAGPTCQSHSYSSKSYYSKKESKHSKKSSKKSYSSDSKSSKCHTQHSSSPSTSIDHDHTHSTDHNNDNNYENYAGDEMQTGGTTHSNNDERVRRKDKRRRFPNGIEVNQDNRSADKTNNDSNVGDGNARRRRRRFPNGAN